MDPVMHKFIEQNKKLCENFRHHFQCRLSAENEKAVNYLLAFFGCGIASAATQLLASIDAYQLYLILSAITQSTDDQAYFHEADDAFLSFISAEPPLSTPLLEFNRRLPYFRRKCGITDGHGDEHTEAPASTHPQFEAALRNVDARLACMMADLPDDDTNLAVSAAARGVPSKAEGQEQSLPQEGSVVPSLPTRSVSVEKLESIPCLGSSDSSPNPAVVVSVALGYNTPSGLMQGYQLLDNGDYDGAHGSKHDEDDDLPPLEDGH